MGKFDQFDEINFDDLRTKIKQEQAIKEAGSKEKDKSYIFKPKLEDKKQQSSYLVRFLPNVHQPDNKFPWVEASAHMFRRADGKFIYTMCPYTFHGTEAKCPICEKSRAYFATLDKVDEGRGRDLWRKLRFFVNVLVIEDPRVGPENQKGKVLIWEIGKKIHTKLSIAFETKKLNFWSPSKGRNFRLIVTKQGEHDNYDNSDFDYEVSPISEDNAEMDRIFDSIHNIQEKSIGHAAHTYEKLEQLMTGVAATSNKGEKVVGGSTHTTESVAPDAPVKATKPPVAEVKKSATKVASAAAPAAVAPEVDDDLFNFDDDAK